MSLVQKDYDTLKACLDKFAAQLAAVEATGHMIVERLRAGKTVFACGNGGSATDSMHLCEELVGRYRGNRRPLPAVSLNTDTSVLTCIGNDYGFDEIFSRQIEALGKSDDILVGFSTSGNSENVARAFTAAKKNGVTTILLAGKDGGKIKAIADHAIIVESDNTARIQELHTFILHAWLELVEVEDWKGEGEEG
ncbi:MULTISPECIES: SIS domain-containing protein [unclassified Lentimonas]|uniref:D-sedoheptulose-7-phosphate isomerase n=1 Tax=unclassified Lentimonas TaxID=2630993 RepID=UPI0013273458|nr:MULTISPECIES: SIS domain-containing protein [unclassified Lentimonas]CAA6691366.1 Phosphoheptose isomerase 1 (EC [Lentimonas sp. CC19]CAA6694922.1 Phosphoheptose isomerase 1 (EC [Lentimonas sp. CC10]CAA7071894.1 Phosphoheptose isomerase 1 (EC [Lentimonas sp. CC11]